MAGYYGIIGAIRKDKSVDRTRPPAKGGAEKARGSAHDAGEPLNKLAF